MDELLKFLHDTGISVNTLGIIIIIMMLLRFNKLWIIAVTRIDYMWYDYCVTHGIEYKRLIKGEKE